MTMDVVVPSYRADPAFLQHFFALQVPDNVQVHWYIIIDNPDKDISGLLARFASPSITIVQNRRNRGASPSRNSGLELGTGEWIVFIDDDVIPSPDLLLGYVSAIALDHAQEFVGFSGVTDFPPPSTPFHHAVRITGMNQFYDIARRRATLTWAVTANVCVNRQRLGKIRFQEDMPKAGGGEDVMFGLDILTQTGRHFGSASEALAVHPWWNRGFIRFWRWGFGDTALPQKFPEHTLRRLPSSVELTLAIIVILSLATFVSQAVLAVHESGAERVRLAQRGRIVLGSAWSGLRLFLVMFLLDFLAHVIVSVTSQSLLLPSSSASSSSPSISLPLLSLATRDLSLLVHTLFDAHTVELFYHFGACSGILFRAFSFSFFSNLIELELSLSNLRNFSSLLELESDLSSLKHLTHFCSSMNILHGSEPHRTWHSSLRPILRLTVCLVGLTLALASLWQRTRALQVLTSPTSKSTRSVSDQASSSSSNQADNLEQASNAAKQGYWYM